ncbi:MAG: hypothetical protein HQ541_03990 [Mariniphaga sp.]|nr:hypothetical protein [Mariniphaga sp.]
MKQLLATLVLFYIITSVFPQGIEELAPQQKPVVYEKVYLHIDRELYSPGDTIWFKSYLVSGITHKFLPGFKNIYVQLISTSGEVISNRLLFSFYGESFGDIALNDSLPVGQYTIRARTKYLENFGEESYFHKRIWVSKPKSSLELDLPDEKAPKEIEAMFFPEGGMLVYNATNHIAFKVISTDGRGVEASGFVINQNNDTITRFKTSFLGMGRFTLMPKEGEKYYTIIDNYPETRQEFGNILKDGFTLNYKDAGNDVLFTVLRDFKETGKKNIYLRASHKGIDLFQREISIDGFTQAIKLSKTLFPLGISKITVIDDNSNILAERLVFIDVNYGNTVKVETSKEEYSTREKVELKLEPILAPNDSVTSTLSVSVVSEDYLSSVGNSQNIKSYLLVDSELKGAIESPALYFFDEETITAAEKLNLLMMVQGWRSYYWDEIVEKVPDDLYGWSDAGLSYSGYVKRLFRNKDIIEGKVSLTSFSPRLFLEETTTDSVGRFRFERLFLADSTEVMVTARNERGKKNVEIIPDTISDYEFNVDTKLIDQILGGINIPMKYYREIYMQQMAEREYIFEEGAIVIEEITVVGSITDEDIFELTKPHYNFFPDNTYIITKVDYQYENIYNFILKKVGSTWLDKYIITRDKLHPIIPRIRYIVDGKTQESFQRWIENKQDPIEDIPIQNIYRIDLQKTIGKTVKEFYYIFTKKNPEFKSANWGKVISLVNGFQQPNRFYSPKYSLKNINNKMPDYRPTLYWSPEVVVKDGKANIEFFTCDNLSNYVVIVEGISKNGKICYGVERFSVINRNDY